MSTDQAPNSHVCRVLARTFRDLGSEDFVGDYTRSISFRSESPQHPLGFYGTLGTVRNLYGCMFDHASNKEKQSLARVAVHFLFMRQLKIHEARMRAQDKGSIVATFSDLDLKDETWKFGKLGMVTKKNERFQNFIRNVDAMSSFRYLIQQDSASVLANQQCWGRSYCVTRKEADSIRKHFLQVPEEYYRLELAVCMGMHARLGRESAVYQLDSLLAWMVMGMVKELFMQECLAEDDYSWVNRVHE